MTRRRVLLADDHAQTMQLWRTLLEPEFDVVGAVHDGESLVDAAERLAPDVIVSDIVMPGMSGIAAAGAILRRQPAARIIFATVHADSALLRSSLAAGAYAYVLKVRAADDLVPAVRAALRGELLISPFPHSDAPAGWY
jgi:two-component system nitrate/nitrite response regulator NarL